MKVLLATDGTKHGEAAAKALNTFALADGRGPDEALALAARAGTTCLTGRGPYEKQLSADAL